MRTVVVVPGRALGPGVPRLLFPAYPAIRCSADPTWVQWSDAESVDLLSGPAGAFVPGPLARSAAATMGLLASAAEILLDGVVWPVG